MPYPLDEPRLARVREAMERDGIDVLVARAPDNVVYLGNYWSMKGQDFVILPREGDATLVVVEPQAPEALRHGWTDDVRTFPLYDPSDPRPPHVRSLAVCLDALRERGLAGGRIGLELSHAVQGSDRMAGEPTVPTLQLVHAFEAAGEVRDATPLLVRARAIKTSQEVERIRLANEIAGEALDRVREELRPGMRVSEVGAIYEAHAHAVGIGYRGRVDFARAFVLALSGSSIRMFTATSEGVVSADEPTLLEIWVCADGYWCDLGKTLCAGPLTPTYDRMYDVVLEMYEEGVDRLRDGVPLAEVDRQLRRRIAESGFPDQVPFPMLHGVGARAHEPPWAHEAGEGEIREGMVLAIEPGIYLREGGAIRLEDNFLVTADGPERLGTTPDDFRV